VVFSTFTILYNCEFYLNKKAKEKKKKIRNPMVCFLSKKIQCQSAQLTKKGALSVSGRRTLGPGLFANKQAHWKSHITPRLGVNGRRPLRKRGFLSLCSNSARHFCSRWSVMRMVA